ncbi:MAG: NHL repeat-containing protein [Armatimonadota bacterium]
MPAICHYAHCNTRRYLGKMQRIVVVTVLLAACTGLFADPFTPAAGELLLRYSVNGFHPDARFREPAAVALDEHAGLIYVADRESGVVSAFSLQGVAKFRYDAEDGVKNPVGLAVDRDGNVFIAEDEGGPIKIIDARRQVATLELPVAEGQPPAKPGRMVFDRDGNLYIVERASCRIMVFDRNRQFTLAFGSIGDKQGQFKALQDVAVDRQGRIYALDSIGDPVQVFDRKGGYLTKFALLSHPGGATLPIGLCVDRHDQLWVIDQAQHCLKVFDRSGTLLRQFGEYGQGEGQLFYPIDTAVDGFGRVYVVEMGARRLQVFSVNRPFEPFIPNFGI